MNTELMIPFVDGVIALSLPLKNVLERKIEINIHQIRLFTRLRIDLLNGRIRPMEDN